MHWSVHGTPSETLLENVRQAFPEARQLPAPIDEMPVGWNGVALFHDHWVVPVDRESVTASVFDRLEAAETKSFASHGLSGSLARSAELAMLLTPPRCGFFAIREEHLATVIQSSHPADPWWPGLLRLAAEGQLATAPSRAMETPLASLAPTRPPASRDWLRDRLQTCDVSQWLGEKFNPVEEAAFRAGLLIWHDYLDEGHSHAQSIEGEVPGRGDHWHAIMHRREPDYGNAKYWYRRVRQPKWMVELPSLLDHQRCVATEEDRLRLQPLCRPNGSWDPLAFVDFCQRVTAEDSREGTLARVIQRVEMMHLLQDSLDSE